MVQTFCFIASSMVITPTVFERFIIVQMKFGKMKKKLMLKDPDGLQKSHLVSVKLSTLWRE